MPTAKKGELSLPMMEEKAEQHILEKKGD